MVGTLYDYAFVPDKRTGEYLFWSDTGISLWRLGIGVGIAIAVSLVLGVLAGFIPWVSALVQPFVPPSR